MRRAVILAVGATAAVSGPGFGPAVWALDKAEGGQRVEERTAVRTVGRGFLGVRLAELEGDARGAKVQSVEAGSPAEKAGLKEGDVVARFDGEAVRSAAQLSRLVRETPAGRSVPIEIARGGATQKLTVTLGEGDRLAMPDLGSIDPRAFRFELPAPPRPPEPPTAPLAPQAPRNRVFRFGPNAFDRVMPGPRRLGITFIDMGEQLASHYKLTQRRGVLVTSVDEGSPAGKAGVQAGDVVLDFDGHAVQDGDQLLDAVANAEGGKTLAMKVQRDGRPLELKVTLTAPESKSLEGGVTL